MAETQRLLELALKGLEAERARIDDEILQIQRQLGGRGGRRAEQPLGVVTTGTSGNRRTMSAAARKRISEGMKRRYAALRAATQPAETSKPKPKRGRGLTAAGRRKLSEMMKARWAAKKKASKRAA